MMYYWNTLSSHIVVVVQTDNKAAVETLGATNSGILSMLRRVVKRMLAVWEKWNNSETRGCNDGIAKSGIVRRRE